MSFQRNLSKLVAFRQCPKRLWLEVHRPEFRQESAATQAVFQTGHEVGAMAQRLYDPKGTGKTIDFKTEGVSVALGRTEALLKSGLPIFEAGFAARGALAFADVLLPDEEDGELGWRMVEVKASTSVKAYQEDDVAIQSYVAKACGVVLHGVAIAHIDSSWVYPGGGDYRGLLVEADLSKRAFSRHDEVKAWIAEAQCVADLPQSPDIAMGCQCIQPFDCGFVSHCSAGLEPPEFPVAWLPRIQSRTLKSYIEDQRVNDMREVPVHLLTELQRRVRDVTVNGRIHFDAPGAARELSQHPLPAYFLDFETIQFGVPRWAGTRPFQMVPFQFSVHRLSQDGVLTTDGFLDLTGNDPSEAFARALAQACQERIPVFVYNAGFEGARLAELARRFDRLREPLLEIKRRLVDLHPIAQRYYYHPGQQGSWSIKKVLPTIAPHLDYSTLVGVQDGGLAMQAYLEATDQATAGERKAELERQLVDYCALDTLAMVKLWKFFTGRTFSTQ